MRRDGVVLALLTFACLAACIATAAEPPIRADQPNPVAFPEQEARLVRFVVHATNDGAQPCLDELEVYGPDPARNLALARNGAKASASSCLEGYPIHAIPHLNDGQYGNDHSWIAAGASEEWAQIELPQPAKVSKVVFSRDRARQYGDRVPVAFEIRLSLDGKEWRTARKVATTAASVPLVARANGPAPVVPYPPPPPRLSREGAAPSADLRAAEKDALGFPNLARGPQARPAASSVFQDGRVPIHQVAHLNDGLEGNAHSWISKGEPSWAEIDLGGVYWVCKVAFGSDSSQQYGDRAATSFAILAATRYDRDSTAASWQTVYQQADGPPVHVRREFRLRPVQARWVRVAIAAASSGEARVDEIEVFGQRDSIPPDRMGPLPPRPALARSEAETASLLRYAFLGEEHAWAQAYGRADLDPALVPYNGRVKEYPRHVGDDRLPLPPLGSAPKLDGVLDDACWADASRGVVRVSAPSDFERGPLVTHEVLAGWRPSTSSGGPELAEGRDGDLFLAIRTDELLSSHIAVVSDGAWGGCGVVSWTKDGLVFNTYQDASKPAKSTPIEGAFDKALTACEIRLPLSLFPNCRERGIRVGLGMGGRHTSPLGRPVSFAFSSLSLAELPPCRDRTFRVRLAAAPGGPAVSLTGDARGLEAGLTLAPGQSKILSLPARRGAIGPELDLTIRESGLQDYALHLFRCDPLERTLALMGGLVERLAAKGLDLRAERAELARFRDAHETLRSTRTPDLAAERKLFLEARLAKRRLFFRDPDLAPIEKILFVARHPFLPSHIYTDYTDAPFRPGGAVCTLEIPRHDGRLEPAEARLARLFEARGGIPRDPAATFDLRTIYFGYRPSADGYYHTMAMNADGSGLRQVTDGPFHDFYPCPLPDGGVAFTSTRCIARVFCFRGGSSVLFRMNADGTGIRPLSLASLSEWAPSVMRDGRILWTRWEYVDKGADFSQTLWAIRPDGSHPEHVFGNTIIQPNGYACGREVPGTGEISCTLVSHFGDINGPIALLDIHPGRLNPKAISSLTPEVPWPGMWPRGECFRDPVPLSRDLFLCAHAPLERFGLYVIDRFGNREFLHFDPTFGCMAPTPFRASTPPAVVASSLDREGAEPKGQFVLLDVYRGLEPAVPRGAVKYLRVVEEVRHEIEQSPNGEYRKDHADFMKWYASPVDVVSGPFGWPTYVAKAPLGLVPVEADGSARFTAPAS